LLLFAAKVDRVLGERIMKLFGTIPLMLSVLVGFLLSLVTVRLLRLRHSATEGSLPGSGDALLLGLLALAAFAMGAFLTYLLVGLFL
jgi:hypothetical protein